MWRLGEDKYARVRRTSAFYNLLTQWERGKTSFSGGRTERVRMNMVDMSRHLGFNVQVMQVPLIALCHFIWTTTYMVDGLPL